jgi:SAM-dependent methyltransferase
LTGAPPAPYDANFFLRHSSTAAGSARQILPPVLDWTGARSLVDVGCGIGDWARVAMDLGVEDVLGIDGRYVDLDELAIPADRFLAADLAEPLHVGRRFDLVISMEVAEHLRPARATSFVHDLCSLGDAVLFSAAVPGQGGRNHVNEQWQTFWAELFTDHGYEVFDVVRPRVWSDPQVAVWYRQNAFLAARGAVTAQLRELEQGGILDCIHPELWRRNLGPRELARQLPRSLGEAVRKRLPGAGAS